MRTRIADDTKAIAERMRQLKQVPASDRPKDYSNGYFFEILSKSHRGQSGRVLVVHPYFEPVTDTWSICLNCKPARCNCAIDKAQSEVDEYDPEDDGPPDVYFCKDCP